MSIDRVPTIASHFRRDRATSTLAAFSAMVSLSLSVALSFLILPGAAHFDVPTEKYLVWFSIQILTAGVVFSFVGRLIRQIGVRPVFSTGGLLCALSLVGAAFTPELLVFYMTAVPFGIGIACATILPANVLITEWHDHERRGTVLGIISLGSAVGAIVWGFVMPPIVSAEGFRGGILTVAALFVIFAGLPGLLLVRQRASADLSETLAAPHHTSRRPGEVVVLLSAATALFAMTLAYDQLQPAVLSGLGVDVTTAGHIVSLSALSGIAWMPLLGYVHDRFSLRATGFVLAAPFVLGLPLLALLVPLGVGAIWAIVPIISLSLTIPVVSVPLLAAESMSRDAFPVAYGVILSTWFVCLALFALLWELLFSVTHAYTTPMLVSGVAGLVAVGLAMSAVTRARHRRAQLDVLKAEDELFVSRPQAEVPADTAFKTRRGYRVARKQAH